MPPTSHHARSRLTQLEFLSRCWWPGAIKDLRSTLTDPATDFARQPENKCGTGYHAHRFNDCTRQLFADWQFKDRPFYINRFDIARDQKLNNDLDLVEPYMDDLWDRLYLKWASPKARRTRVGAINFYLDDSHRGRVRRNCLVYMRPGRPGPRGFNYSSDTIRTELQLENTDVVRRNGLDDMGALPGESLEAVFWRNLKMRALLTYNNAR